MLSALTSASDQAATATPLHISGNQILTANGTPLILKGMDYTYFMDSEGGSWMMPDGSIEWMTNPMDKTGVADFLDFMQASNCNVVRLHLTVQYWLDNSNNYQSNLEYFITQAANRGIYTEMDFYRNNATGGEPVGYLPWQDAGNNVLNSSADFVNLWGNVSATLKNYPTVMFELWNEPSGNEALWFNVTQQCINNIRSTGATQPIVIQWDVCIYFNFYAGYSPAGVGSSMNWVTDYPLNDPSGNLIYSTHLYRNNFFNSSNGYQQVYSYSDMHYVLSACGVLSVAATHPVFIGEIGCSLWATDEGNEMTWYNNTLTILEQNRIGYAGFAAPPWRSEEQWGLVYAGLANYTLDAAGVILVNHISGMNYTDWLNLQQSIPPSPTRTPTPSLTPAPTSTPVSTPTLSASPTPIPAATIGGISTDTAIIIVSAVVLVMVATAFGAYAYTKRNKKNKINLVILNIGRKISAR